MEQIILHDIQNVLKGTPRPHYLVGEAKIDLLEGNKIRFAGTALFPLSDPSIADRKDHVNVTATLFALWNAAHLMGRQKGLKHFRATKLSISCFKVFLPENIVSFTVSAKFVEVPSPQCEMLITELVPQKKVNLIDSLVYGSLQATFALDKEKVAEIECRFVGW